MTQIVLEHINVTVRDAQATAEELCTLFDWKVRWHGDAMDGKFPMRCKLHGSVILFTDAGAA